MISACEVCTCGTGSRACSRLWPWTVRLTWSETSWRWWYPGPDAGSPGNTTAPPAAPWWTSPMLAKCCWVAARRRPILTQTRRGMEFFCLAFLSPATLPILNVSLLSLETSSSSCHVILLPRSFFFSVVWLPRPMVIFPALFAPFTRVLESVLCGVRGRKRCHHCVQFQHQNPSLWRRNNPKRHLFMFIHISDASLTWWCLQRPVSQAFIVTEKPQPGPEASVPLLLFWKIELRCCLSCCKSKGAEDGLWVANPLQVLPENLHHLWAHLLIKSHLYQLEQIWVKQIIQWHSKHFIFILDYYSVQRYKHVLVPFSNVDSWKNVYFLLYTHPNKHI